MLCTNAINNEGKCHAVNRPTRSSAIAEGPRDCVASYQLKFANCHATVQKLLVRQVLNQASAVAN